ncbi:MAG: TetR/AcrR family transcriptional regulator [Desulfatibacillum sp.]|nr:TetR/AcrR family transcriptional regulator [Desulfatibacillum sp.]
MTIKRFMELRKAQKENRRQTIVEVAEEILTTKGIDAVTIRSVAKAAGLSVGSIYMYFKNKEELFLCMLLGHLEKLDKAFASRIQGEDALQVLKAMANDYKDYYLACGRHINVIGYLYEQRNQAGEINPTLLNDLETLLASVLAKTQVVLENPAMAPILKGLEASRAIPVMWSIMTGVAELTLTSPRGNQSGFDFDRVLDDTMHILFKKD